MTIRRALVWLVLIAVLPVLMAGTVSLVSLYQSQHAAAGQLALERVRALRIALDVEIASTQRLLATTAARSQLRQPSVVVTPELTDAMRRLASANDMWAAAFIVEPDGTETLRFDAASSTRATPAPTLDEPTRKRVLTTGAAQLSPLVGAPGGPLYSYVAVPVESGGEVVRVLAVAVPNQAWLAFLRRHPIDADATLTLNDSTGRIVARTRDNERWAGRQSRPEYWQRTQQAAEGHFSNTSLEGVAFRSAFSRLGHGDWVLGTGTPADAINRSVWRQAGLLGGLLVVALLTTLGLAFWLGRRITGALQDLAFLASSPQSSDAAAPVESPGRRILPLVEAEAVRQALHTAFEREVELRRAAELSRTEREEFVATLAHELRNPLGAIQNSLVLVELPGVDPDKKVHATTILKRQVAQLTRLMADLFEASRPHEAGLRLATGVVDLVEVCRDAADALQAEGRLSQVTLELDLQPVSVQADPARLQQVISNLLGNAAKFSPDGGVVRLTVARDDSDAVITVADSGVGIPPELIDQIFEPFVQGVPGQPGGLGLGLHVVRRIVELHRGTVKACSAGVHRGTTVTVRLPALPATALPDGPKPVATQDDRAS